jgi:glycerol transport system ATP-binding protein
VLFDEPLTVIDPHLKWQLRRKLKQIHHELKLTLIYVTHDQVEALTFADQVVVMTRGRTVQVGSAEALFERPQHTFVGHFIGSPGMNFLPAMARGGQLEVAGQSLPLPASPALPEGPRTRRAAGVPDACRCPRTWRGARYRQLLRVQDIGTYRLITARLGEHLLRARLPAEPRSPLPGQPLWLQLLGDHTCFYRERGADRMKPVNQKRLVLILPVVLCVAFSAILPLMTVVNYSVQDIIRPSAASSSAPSGSRR